MAVDGRGGGGGGEEVKREIKQGSESASERQSIIQILNHRSHISYHIS